MKKIIALLLACMLLVSLFAACGGNGNEPVNPAPEANGPSESNPAPEANPAPQGPTTLRVLLESEPEGMDPAHSKFLSSYVFAPITTAIYVPLVVADENGAPAPSFATSWEWIDDLHLRLTIRDDVVSASGAKLTTEDVLYSFQCGAGGPGASFFTMFDFDNFEIESETSIVLALNTHYPSLVEAFLSPCYMVYAKTDIESITDPANTAHTCTGRYVIKEWVPAQSITVVKNENYFDPDNAGYYDEIVYTFNADGSARALALQSGDCDVASNIDVSQIATLESNGFTPNLRDTEDTTTLYLNCSRAPFDNEKVRQAVTMLINREAIRAVLYSGYGSVVDTVFSAATQYYQEYTGTVDVEAAKALLTEAGYPDGFTFTISGLQNTSLAAEVIQANLAEAGIKAEINAMDFGAYIGARTSGDYDALIGIAGATDYANVIKAFDGRLTIDEAFGGAQYYGDEFSYELIDAAHAELELEPRKAAIAELCDYLTDKGVMVGLCSVSRCDPCRADITGMRFCTSVFVDVSAMHPVA